MYGDRVGVDEFNEPGRVDVLSSWTIDGVDDINTLSSIFNKASARNETAPYKYSKISLLKKASAEKPVTLSVKL